MSWRWLYFEKMLPKKLTYLLTYAPINAKPDPPPPPGTGGGFVNLEVQRTHPRGNIIWQTPGKYPRAWQFYLYYLWFTCNTLVYRQTAMIYWLYKVPTPRARFYWQSPPLSCPGRGVVGLCIDRCIITPKVSLNSSHLQAQLLSMLSSLWVEFHVVHLSWQAKEQVTQLLLSWRLLKIGQQLWNIE